MRVQVNFDKYTKEFLSYFLSRCAKDNWYELMGVSQPRTWHEYPIYRFENNRLNKYKIIKTKIFSKITFFSERPSLNDKHARLATLWHATPSTCDAADSHTLLMSAVPFHSCLIFENKLLPLFLRFFTCFSTSLNRLFNRSLVNSVFRARDILQGLSVFDYYILIICKEYSRFV